MAIYAIADLHLSFEENKPMDIFGDNWKNHEVKIKQDWLSKVTDNDLVLLPGDFSWAMHLKNTKKDFEYLSNMPGKKLMLKGNHDYWWETVSKMRAFLKENNHKNIDFLYNNSYEFENYIIVGTKGCPISEEDVDEKILNRELIRLELSLKDAVEKYGNEKEILVCMHYPPITKNKILNHEELKFVELMKKYNVKKCLYGHLHGNSINDALEGTIENIEFKLVSADGLNFKLYKVN